MLFVLLFIGHIFLMLYPVNVNGGVVQTDDSNRIQILEGDWQVESVSQFLKKSNDFEDENRGKRVNLYLSQLLTLQRLTNFRDHMKQSRVLSKTIKIALFPMIKTITASTLPQNPQKTKLADLKCTSGK